MSYVLSPPPKTTDNEPSTSTTKSGYIPPSLRKATTNKKESSMAPVEVTAQSFPTLGESIASQQSTAQQPQKAIWANSSFKNKIDNLIAFEKLSEMEKLAKQEASQSMEGFVRLPLHPTLEQRMEFSEQLTQLEENIKTWNMLVDTGMQDLLLYESTELKTDQQ